MIFKFSAFVLSFSIIDNDSRVLKKLKVLNSLHDTFVIAKCGHKALLEFDHNFIKLNHKKFESFLDTIPKIYGVIFYVNVLKVIPRLVLRASLIDVNDLYPLPFALLAKLMSFGRIKVIYDCHEYETEVQYFNHRPFIKKLYKLLESICLKFVDEVICVTDSIAEAYVVDYGIKKPHLIMNCPPFRASFDKGTLFRKKFGIRDDQSIYLYQGSITRGRGVSETIAAFKLLEDSFVLIFMGYGELVGEVIVAQKNCSRIFYHEAVPPGVLLDYTASADYGICFAPNICKSYYYSLSNKIFEYIQARLPLIVSPLFEFKRLVESENIGTVARGDDVESLIETIRKTADLDRELFRSNCNKVASLYCWENQSKILESIYKKYL